MDVNTTINASMPLLDPYVFEPVHRLVEVVGVFVGGIFGFYIISIILAFYNYRKNAKRLKRIEKNIDEMNKTLKDIQKKLGKKR